MEASIINNSHWEYKRGEVIKEEADFVTVRIVDTYNHNLAYNVRFPRSMVKFEKTIAQA